MTQILAVLWEVTYSRTHGQVYTAGREAGRLAVPLPHSWEQKAGANGFALCSYSTLPSILQQGTKPSICSSSPESCCIALPTPICHNSIFHLEGKTPKLHLQAWSNSGYFFTKRALTPEMFRKSSPSHSQSSTQGTGQRVQI